MMVRDFFFPNADVLPRKRESRPDGLGTHLLWTRKGEWSSSDSLAQLLMPKEWARVEALREARRERILKQMATEAARQAVPLGIEAGRIVAEEAEEVNDTPEESRGAAAPHQGSEEQDTSQHHSGDGAGRDAGGTERGDGDRSVDSRAGGGAREGNAEDSATRANGEVAGSHTQGKEVAADGAGQGGEAGEHASAGATPNAQPS